MLISVVLQSDSVIHTYIYVYIVLDLLDFLKTMLAFLCDAFCLLPHFYHVTCFLFCYEPDSTCRKRFDKSTSESSLHTQDKNAQWCPVDVA